MEEISDNYGEPAQTQWGEGAIREVVLGQGSITVGRFETYRYYHVRLHRASARQLRILPQARPEIRLIYLLKGQQVYPDRVDRGDAILCGEANGFFVPQGYQQEIRIDGDPCEVMIAVTSVPDFIQSVGGEENGEFTCHLGMSNLLFGFEQAMVINQLIHYNKPTYLLQTYRQVKLAELFVLFFEQADEFISNRDQAGLRPEELARIRRVRDILHDRPAESYSLVGLAHAVGTNEASLKKNFKAVYGVTVFGYLTARRMERAKALLLANNLKVAAVAQEVGYKYASHFSAAFRKHFGVLPTKLLRTIVSFPSLFPLAELEMFAPFVVVC